LTRRRFDIAKVGVQAWVTGHALLERYRYAPGPPGRLPLHVHDEYQWGLSVDFPGVYRYRGRSVRVAAGSLSVLHPGEPHFALDPHERRRPASYLMMYLSPEAVADVATELAGRSIPEPFFREPVIVDPALAATYARMHSADELAHDVLRHDFLIAALRRYARVPVATEFPREPAAVAAAAEYLREHYADPVRLDDLGRAVGLSAGYLSRAFRRAIGVPPHRFQLQVRLEQAKRMLARGESQIRVAVATGFADQSHFSRRFQAYIGCPPGRYRAEVRNVQDTVRARN
jgi:AraC-like DNA-binding protein